MLSFVSSTEHGVSVAERGAQAEKEHCLDTSTGIEVENGSPDTEDSDSSINEESVSFVKKAGDANVASTPWKRKVRQLSRGALEQASMSTATPGEVSETSTRTTRDVLVALKVVQEEAAEHLAIMMQGIQTLSHENQERWSTLKPRVLAVEKTVQAQTRENNELETKFKDLATKMRVVDTVHAALDDDISAIGQAVTDVDSRCSALEVTTTSRKPTSSWVLPVVCLLAVVSLCGVRAYADAKETTFFGWLKALDELPDYLVRFWNGPTPTPTLAQLLKNAVLDIVGKAPSPTPAVTFSSLTKATLTRLMEHTAPRVLAVRDSLRPLVEKTISRASGHFVHCVEISAPRLRTAHDLLRPLVEKTASRASAHFVHCVEISAPLLSAFVRPFVESVRSWAAVANAHWMSIGLWLHRHV
ncbi:hypothetical protein CBOM_01251 [Ceraceosorus bombacis]|uniref:Uncharacterized protein n=1 Tax=Ceraceosorus bombacis TaxID=401625 RepID=A0A0P1BBG1_9BASI|nr:hypothetical protein CBOM_01251 [Ceraceosorus bombacis]